MRRAIISTHKEGLIDDLPNFPGLLSHFVCKGKYKVVNFAAADGNDRATSIPANIEIACLFYACQLTSAHHESLIHEYTSDDGEKHEIRRPFTCPSTGTNLTKRALVSRLSCARVNPSALSSG